MYPHLSFFFPPLIQLKLNYFPSNWDKGYFFFFLKRRKSWLLLFKPYSLWTLHLILLYLYNCTLFIYYNKGPLYFIIYYYKILVDREGGYFVACVSAAKLLSREFLFYYFFPLSLATLVTELLFFYSAPLLISTFSLLVQSFLLKNT